MSNPAGVDPTPIIDVQQLVAVLADGSKSEVNCKVGFEHELFVFLRSDLSPCDYQPDGIGQLLELSCERGWEPISNRGTINRRSPRKTVPFSRSGRAV